MKSASFYLKVSFVFLILAYSFYILFTLPNFCTTFAYQNLCRLTFGAIYGYLLGAFPTGYVLVYLFQKKDIRQIGSKSMGATNVLRTGSKILAVLTLIIDALKGFVAVSYLPHGINLLVPQVLCDHCNMSKIIFVCSVFSLLGHCFSFWLNFRGGKGIATALGILVGLNPLIACVVLSSWLFIAFIFKISSLASLTATLVALGVSFWLSSFIFQIVLCLAPIIFFQHRQNILRLIKHQEPVITHGKDIPPKS